MQLMLISKDHPIEPCESLETIPPDAFAWLDVSRSESVADWSRIASSLTGVTIHEAHLQDAQNERHPSTYDVASEYEVIVFRGILPSTGTHDDESSMGMRPDGKYEYGPENALPFRIVTAPACLLLFPQLLVTVRSDQAPQTAHIRDRLLSNSAKAPVSPEDLAQRILNAMIDRYLELRVPLAERLDRWQRDLLDPTRPFNDWHALLDQRTELRILEHLCEEQRDAIQEWTDERRDAYSDAMNVRMNDLINHIERVLSHAQQLEKTAESAVQLHFSATAHRTNQIMRTLTVLNAIFLPLTLIAGIFGMNFKNMPLLDWKDGFWLTLVAMGSLAGLLLLYFWAKKYFDADAHAAAAVR
jgi:magnesium/cobalt transport protein CorA